jgi:hypothetical protein
MTATDSKRQVNLQVYLASLPDKRGWQFGGDNGVAEAHAESDYDNRPAVTRASSKVTSSGDSSIYTPTWPVNLIR